MADPTSVLVAFGLDPDGKPRAARFDDDEADLAIKAATLLGYRVAAIAGGAVVDALPAGNVFARGRGLIPRVGNRTYEKLCAAVGENALTVHEKREPR